MHTSPFLLDSIADATPAARDGIAVCGSHGGMIAAVLASRAGLRGVLLNDAGIGLNRAGLRGVMALDDVGMAAAAVASGSARIGSARDALAHGILSATNATGSALGLRAGQRVADALPLLAAAPTPTGELPPLEEARIELVLVPGAPAVICVDSATLIRPEDAGRIIVAGSHGALVGGDPSRACKARARLVAFNDAGGGKDGVGFGRLAPLDAQGVAALTLDAMSCEIGDARSALRDGRISAVNEAAAALGLRKGGVLEPALRALIRPV